MSSAIETIAGEHAPSPARTYPLPAVIAVTDQVSMQTAVDYINGAKALCDKVAAWFKPKKDAAYKAHKELTTSEKEELAPIEAFIKSQERPVIAFRQQQERERLRAEEEARRAAQRQAEQEQLDAAVELEAAGMKDEAEATLAAPVQAAPVILPAPPKPIGVSFTKTYSARVTNEKALLAAVAAGTAPRTFFAVNQAAVNQWARSTRGTMSIPGVEVVETTSTRR